MELIDRYIYAVGRRLPHKLRADIEKELRSLIMDELDAKTGGGEPAEEDVSAVLTKIGPPDTVAAQYGGRPQHLIGPDLFPLYKMVAAIVFAAMAMGLVITFIINLLSNGGNLFLPFLALLGQIVTGGASALGFVTIAFAILERLVARGKVDAFIKEVNEDADIQKAKEWFDHMKWEPEKLKPVPKKEDATKPVDHILGIAFTLIVLVLFNRFSDRLAFSLGGSACTPIFSREALSMFLPLWNISWVLSIGKDGLLLVRGRKELGTRIYEIVLSLLDIVILYLLLTGPFIISDAMMALLREHIPFLGSMLRVFLMAAFGIGLVATGVQAVINIVRLVRDRAQV